MEFSISFGGIQKGFDIRTSDDQIDHGKNTLVIGGFNMSSAGCLAKADRIDHATVIQNLVKSGR